MLCRVAVGLACGTAALWLLVLLHESLRRMVNPGIGSKVFEERSLPKLFSPTSTISTWATSTQSPSTVSIRVPQAAGSATGIAGPPLPIHHGKSKSRAPSKGGAGTLWEELPVVKGYSFRGQVACGDYAWRGSVPGARETNWKTAIVIPIPASRGLSSIMFWQVKFMVAWMLRRPILLTSDGPLFKLLHSRHRPETMQVSNITTKALLKKLGATVEADKFHTKFRDKDDCNAHFLDVYSGRYSSINILNSPSYWKLSPNASLFLGVGSKNLRTLGNMVPLECRNRMMRQLSSNGWSGYDQARAMVIVRKFKLFGKCAMRFAMGDPQPDMLRFLHPVLKELATTKAFLVGIHIRMGDTRMSEELGRVSGADDDQRLQVPLQYYLVHVNSLLQTLSWALRPLDAQPVVFVASDSAKAVDVTKRKLAFKVLSNPGLSVHSTDKKASFLEIQKVYGDWYLLALSGILLSPSPGTNCNDGCGSGFSKTAGQLGMPWMSVLGRDITTADMEKVRKLPLEALVEQGIYKRRWLR